MTRIALPTAELAAAIALQGHGTIIIMEARVLSSRRRVATTAYAVLPARGIVGIADDVVCHAFSHGFHPQHVGRLAPY
jgi:hypothetical protein